jgi:hypothetical protein
MRGQKQALLSFCPFGIRALAETNNGRSLILFRFLWKCCIFATVLSEEHVRLLSFEEATRWPCIVGGDAPVTRALARPNVMG